MPIIFIPSLIIFSIPQHIFPSDSKINSKYLSLLKFSQCNYTVFLLLDLAEIGISKRFVSRQSEDP